MAGLAASHLAVRHDERKKAGIAPGLSSASLVMCEAYFASARFGGVAGHDFTSVS